MNPTVTVAGALDSATPPPHCRNRTQDDSSNFASTNRAVNGTKTEKRSKRKQSRPLQRIPTKQRKETNPDSLNAREYTLPLRIQPQHPTTRNFRSSKTKKKKHKEELRQARDPCRQRLSLEDGALRYTGSPISGSPIWYLDPYGIQNTLYNIQYGFLYDIRNHIVHKIRTF